ncbi:MAG TPA: type II toxin-antitoxin system VapC family toxin [Allosphingosinicella sp.]|nr:type II toxin-antitoxin system VapC family toxin [Allosphingosinicella sp.]
MSVVLDSSAVIALMKGEPGSDRVEAVLPEAIISVVNLAEVAAVLSRGSSPQRVRAAVAGIGVVVVPADEETAIAAGLLAPTTAAAGLSLGDRFCLALAQRVGAPVLTGDRVWMRVAADVNVDVQLIR